MIMKNTTLAFLCCSAFLTACDNSSDNSAQGEKSLLDRASSLTSDATDSVVDSVKEKTSDAMDSAKEAASDAMTAGKEAATDAVAAGKDLKETAVDSAGAAVDSVKEMSSAAVEKTSAMIASVGDDDNQDDNQGEAIYKKACVTCHGAGVAGSPKLSDKAAWGARIAQGNAVLTQHAIEGFKGKTGYMPPKGGFMSLSDEEISQAVMYMVSQAQ